MTPEIENAILAMAERSRTRQSDRWADIATVGELLEPLPKRSPERREVTSLIADTCHLSKRTQGYYEALWRVIKQGKDVETGELPLPRNLDYSTALTVIKHGGDLEVLKRADAEGWTLAQARAWAIERTVTPSEDKAVTLWRYLTKRIPAPSRKATVLDWTDKQELIVQVKAAILGFGGGD